MSFPPSLQFSTFAQLNAANVPPIMNVYDLEIDSKARTAKRGERNIPLTEREFELLQFLAVNQGRTVSRSDLCKAIYSEVDWHAANLVNVYIHRLRKKIDDGSKLRLIRTRRGRGYMMLADEKS